MRFRPSVALLAGAAALSLAVAVPAQAASQVVLTSGHVDVVDVEYADGGFELHVHDETVDPGVERDPADVLFRVPVAAKTTVPDDPAYSFLGTAGKPVWVLPQVEDPNLLFAGFATEEVPAGVFAGEQVTLKLCGATGPGRVSVFTTDPFGAPTVVFNSGDGLPDATNLAVGTHTHANWSFAKPGTYKLRFTVSGKVAATNQAIASEPITVTFSVLGS